MAVELIGKRMMPDTREHRGPHPEDAGLFAPGQWPRLRAAASDLAWLLGRDYSLRSAAELVGNRYRLTARQRLAVERCVATPHQVAQRAARQAQPDAVRGQPLWIDGYNVLLTVEVALGGAVVLEGLDGTYRDLASVHGTYRAVAETTPALQLLAAVHQELGGATWTWWFDRPVSNSGRLKVHLQTLAAAQGWNWNVEVVNSPDAVLIGADTIVASADSQILDQARSWFNLARVSVDRIDPRPWIVRLAASASP